MAEWTKCKCGGNAKWSYAGARYMVFCLKCGFQTPSYPTLEEAIAIWNTRDYDSEMERLKAENDALREKSERLCSMFDARFLAGADYAMYEISKEADIGVQDIRDDDDTIDGKCARIAERIRRTYQDSDDEPISHYLFKED